MTRRRIIDVVMGTASERALKAAQSKRQVRQSLLARLSADEALLERAELAADSGQEWALRERDRLAEAIRVTAAALRR